MTSSSLVNVHCLSSKKEWISKWKRNKCTENRMIKLSTAILLLVEVESLVCSREFNFSEIIFVLLVRYFELYLSALLEFCRICTRLKTKKEQNTCFKNLDKGRRWKHFNLRVEGLPLASDGAHDKHDAWFVSYFTYTLSWSVHKLPFACNGLSVGL